MKSLVLAIVSIIFLAIAQFYHLRDKSEINITALQQVIANKRMAAISCTPDWNTFKLTPDEIQQMVPLPGTGTHTWKVSTSNDSAQFYFNQGINLYYGFHIIEALPSFKKAQTFDSTCAMLYWAEALAYGPNINDFGYAASPDALVANKKAMGLSNNATEKEKMLIAAMHVRYTSDSSQKREFLNQRYANFMKDAHLKYSNDPEIGALYADALMIQHPWDLWNKNGTPKPWTGEIQKTLEKVLAIAPDHPGANHYYIHTVEASPHPEKANLSADKLGELTPGLAHMVHMPSHIYIRTGQYQKGIEVNKKAVAQYQRYLKLHPDVVNNSFLYELHNLHMKADCAINKSDYAVALKDAIELRKSIDTSLLSLPAPFGDYIQYMYMTPEMAMISFEKWDDILQQPVIDARHHYAALLQHFAKGLAYSYKQEPGKAKAALDSINELIQQEDIAVVFTPFNAPLSGATIAKYVLMATIAEKENRISEALQLYNKAIETEDAMIYNEPKDWILPARHFLGNALLRNKYFKEAARIFRQNLMDQPNNYTATKGLQLALNRKTRQM